MQSHREEEATLLRFLGLLRRRGWLFVALWGTTVLAAAAIAWAQRTVYRPEATLEIRPEKPLVETDHAGSAGSPLQPWESYLRTQESLLRSRHLLGETLRSLPEETVREYLAAADPPKALAEDLEVQVVPATFLVRVALVHPSPDRGARIVNALAELYLADAHRRLRDLKSDTLEALSTEALPALRQKADEAARSLRDFQAQTGHADFEESHAALVEARRKIGARLSDIRLRRISLRAQRDSLEGLDAGTDVLPPVLREMRALDPLVAQVMALEAELAREMQELKEGHPRLQALRGQRVRLQERIQGTLAATVQALDRELAAAEGEERSLAREQERIDVEVSEARLGLAQGRTLESELTAARDLYNSYLKKYGETRATSRMGLASVRVVEPADAPREPYRKSGLLLALGAILGLLVGGAGILAAEQLDDRVLPPFEKLPASELPVLSILPRVGNGRGPRIAPLLLADDPKALNLEPVRLLRDEIRNRLGGASEAKVVAIAGPERSEGKTTLALNLARVVALEGRRVLLIDAELRRPSLRAMLGGPRGKGLEEFLRGEATLQQAIQSSRIPGVDLLGSDRGLPRPAEAAGTERYRAALQEAVALYDFLVLDVGPVNLYSETSFLAHYADGALLVVHEGRTRNSEVREAARRLKAAGARVLGTVVRSRQSNPGRPVQETPAGPARRTDSESECYVVV